MNALKFYCRACKAVTTLRYVGERKRRGGKRFCASCGDNIELEPYDWHKHHVMTRPETKWAQDDIMRLVYMLKHCDLTHKEMAAELGKTRKAVEHYIYRHGKKLLQMEVTKWTPKTRYALK